MRKLLPAVLFVSLLPLPLRAQQVRLHGQVRPRYEYRDPTTSGKDEFVSMRLRAGLSAELADRVSIFLQLQDVRFWGEESSPLNDFRADNFDVHQGYIVVDRIAGHDLAARVGRQEIALAEERLIGSVDWTQQGQAFDGVRFTADPDDVAADLFAFRLGEDTSGQDDAWLLGAHGAFDLARGIEFDAYGFVERRRATFSTKEWTLGARYAFERGDIDFRLEGSYQLGERLDDDVSAFMVGAALGLQATRRAKITLWYDYLSGDEDPDDGETRVFRTLYATNHRFYGFADLFLDIPAHTGGRGLQDAAVKLAFTPANDLELNLDVHSFRLARAGDLPEAHLGEEIDLTVSHRARSSLTLSGGLSYVFQDDAFAAIGRLSEDLLFGYAMMNVSF